MRIQVSEWLLSKGTSKMPRTIAEIARDINREWKKPYFGAVPYLEAMHQIDGINEMYGRDSAVSVVKYFLSNASSFRGPKAKILKQELKDILTVFEKRSFVPRDN